MVRERRHHVLPGVEVLVRLPTNGVPAFGELLREASKLIEVIDAAVQADRSREVNFSVRGRVLERRIEVPPVEGGKGSANDLHVLLGHCLLLKPGGFEGFVSALEPLLANHLPVAEADENPGQ
jgi:hypothetical protein